MSLPTLYKLKPIDLHSGHYAGASYEINAGGYGNMVLRNNFRADQLLVFILVYEKGVGSVKQGWETMDSVIEIENDITELGTFRQGFDEEHFAFKFEDMTFKVLNDTGVWDIILSQDTISEVRIVYSSYKTSSYNEYRGEFYGIIDKANITHSNDVGATDSMYRKYREYTFTVLNYLSVTREIPILKLRKLLDTKTIKSAIVRYVNVNGKTQNLGKGVWLFENDFIRIDDILKAIIELCYTGDDIKVSVKSDVKFSKRHNSDEANPNATTFEEEWYLDSSKENYNNIFILFRKYPETGVTCNNTFWDGDGFDNNEENKTNFSFFHYENCCSLLKDLMLWFGLVWDVHYEVNRNAPWKFKIYFNLCSRVQNKPIKNLDNECYEGIEGKIEKQKSGVTVTVLNSADVPNSINGLVYRNDRATRELIQSSKQDNIGLATSIMSFFIHKDDDTNIQKNILGQCVYGIFSSDASGVGMLPLDRYSVIYPNGNEESYPLGNRFVAMEGYRISGSTRLGATNNHSLDPAIHRSYFGEMLANYYAGQYGIYSALKNVLSITVDTLDIQPLDKIRLDNSVYIVMQVEKDFIEGSAKLELREW